MVEIKTMATVVSQGSSFLNYEAYPDRGGNWGDA